MSIAVLHDNARQALLDLRRQYGASVVDRAYSDISGEVNLKNFQLVYSLTSRRSSHVCYWRLMGERCPGVACQSPMSIPGYDHGSEWVRDGRTVCIVTQPYHISVDTIKEADAFCMQHGLEIDINVRSSWHYPGWTLMLTYTRQGYPLKE